jgi:hypothetical protein
LVRNVSPGYLFGKARQMSRFFVFEGSLIFGRGWPCFISERTGFHLSGFESNLISLPQKLIEILQYAMNWKWTVACILRCISKRCAASREIRMARTAREGERQRIAASNQRKGWGSEGDAVIRQAISCDICATEKRQTNHWFVAYEQGGELRVSGWNSRYRLRQGAKHLCGQTCLHKLVDEFMAKSIASRSRRPVDEPEAESAPETDTSLTAGAPCIEFESSARLITAPAGVNPASAMPKPATRPQPELVAMPARPRVEEAAPMPDESPRYTSRSWHAEAWERERERELRAKENRSDATSRHRSHA